MAKQLSKGAPWPTNLNSRDFANFRQIHQFYFVKIATLFTWTPFAKTWEYLPNFGEFSANLLFASSTMFLDISRSN